MSLVLSDLFAQFHITKDENFVESYVDPADNIMRVVWKEPDGEDVTRRVSSAAPQILDNGYFQIQCEIGSRTYTLTLRAWQSADLVAYSISKSAQRI